MDLINIYKKIIIDNSLNWVLFKNGTCVLLLQPKADLETQAKKILQDHGLAVVGTPSADFEVTKIPKVNGWVITGNYPGIMIYVSTDEGQNKKDFEIGIIGRNKRELDTKELKIIYVKNKK